MNEAPVVTSEFRFGQFRLMPARQILLKDETPVRLGSRALDLLHALVERPGEVVGRDELIARIWPDTSVAEANLKVQMAALRRALGGGQETDRYVATANGRGYRFVAPVERRGGPEVPASTAAPGHNLAPGWTRPLGREAVVERLARETPERRFVTIVGPGGIGKTTVALALAHSLLGRYRDGVWFVDLSALRDPELLPGVIAAAIGSGGFATGGARALPLLLRDAEMLIVLDCCEHLLDAAAAIAEEIVRLAPGVHVAATSREPLRASGEVVERLEPLATPPAAPLTAAEALRFPAVELFVERAAAARRGFALTDANAGAVAEICRRLDGIALAIELAARRVDAFAIPELLALLADRFRLLTHGRRTDLPRHQTLQAAIDWSFDLLPEGESLILRRLSVFAGAFGLDSAVAVAGDGLARAEVAAGLANLVAKSLVAAETSGDRVQYRLFDSMRAYAASKLGESREAAPLSRRHAGHLLALFRRAEAEWERRPPADWLGDYARSADDLRAALDWAFSGEGDPDLGAALTAASIPLWTALSLVDECRRHMERALDADRARDTDDDAREMKLCAALGAALLQTQGPTPRARDAWRRAAGIAERFGDGAHLVQGLWGLADVHVWAGEHRASLDLTRRTREVAIETRDRAAEVNVGRQAGTALRYLGEFSEARRELERMIERHAPPKHSAHPARFQLDPRIAARGTLANVLWIQGFPDQAMALAERALEDARAADHALALCNAYGHTAIPVALLVGDFGRAEEWLAAFLDHAERRVMPVWSAIGRCLEGMLMAQRDRPEGLGLMRYALDAFAECGFRMRRPAYLGALASGCVHFGRLDEAREALDEALACAGTEPWCLGELLRIEAGLLRASGAPPEEVERTLGRALDWSRERGALSFEWRAALGLAQAWREQGRTAEAGELLSRTHGRFTEGFGTLDLKPAQDGSQRRPVVIA